MAATKANGEAAKTSKGTKLDKYAGDFDTVSSGMFHELNHAQFGWFHVKAILISGVGFFTDAYDLYTVGLISQMIALARFPDHLSSKGTLGSLPVGYDMTVKGTALVGTLIGQLVFGLLGDKLGRKAPYGWTLLIMIFTTIGCAAATWGPPATFIGVFAMWRFLLGIGIGGDYPLSAVITSEYTPRHMRGAMMAAVFSMQGIGFLSASLVAVVVTAAFRSSISSQCVAGKPCAALDHVWRIIVAIGVVPAIATYYLRTRLPETPRFTAHVEKDMAKAEADMRSVFDNTDDFRKLERAHRDTAKDAITWASFKAYLGTKRNALWLFGTASTWFMLDVAFYAQNLYTPKVVSDIGYAMPIKPGSSGAVIYDAVFKSVSGTAIIIIMGLVPGYFITVATVEKMGRRTIQFMGFAMMTILLVICSAAWVPLRAHALWAFIVLYALTFLFANWGPNTTTFIVPGEAFSTKFRSTCHGISAAAGKAGAIVGVYGFGAINDHHGTQLCLGLLSIFMFAGLLFTFLIPETTGMSLEAINDEDVPRHVHLDPEQQDGATKAKA
ncbi:phosphate:H+ symporter [Raphidocelis subcapitata]|uniref:Phosphate:H+ symporter n=1 Tax=Raphidocelis subcapitata TaxID=307507 RepID=A0A2V0PGW2_9CHLO|nr:phosphate:H+ symporter [Raphidocelis subcapitata]|eukprot:GBF98242.1 phosphate:H+ symporter [Raphidocelis subcapitata]